MQITLFQTSDSPNTLNKSLTQIGAAKALTPTQAVSVLSPDIIIGYSAEYLSANMCYIDTFSRYYFCKPEIDTGQRLILHCTVDPLLTYRDSIRNCSICAVRSETAGTGFVIDKQLPVDPSRYFMEGKFFPNDPISYSGIIPVPQARYILLVNGG